MPTGTGSLARGTTAAGLFRVSSFPGQEARHTPIVPDILSVPNYEKRKDGTFWVAHVGPCVYVS